MIRKYSLTIFASLKSGSYGNRYPGCVAGLRALTFIWCNFHSEILIDLCIHECLEKIILSTQTWVIASRTKTLNDL